MHSGTHTIVNDGNGSGLHIRKHVAFVDGSGKNSRSVPSTSPVESKNVKMKVGGNAVECFPLVSSKESETFSSSSSSDSSDFFQVDATKGVKLEACTNPTTNPLEDFRLEIKVDESDVSISSSTGSGSSSECSPGHTSITRIPDETYPSILPGMSPIQSPQIQKMDRSGAYDPFRIPSAVFDRSKSTTPIDWSVASNESLFSIHVGNSSFSRDHVLMLGDLGKSGELRKSGDLFVLNPLPPVPMVETNEKRTETRNESVVSEVADGIIQDRKVGTEYQSERKLPPTEVSWNSSNASQQSDGSGTSTHSFAFPIFEHGTCRLEDEKCSSSFKKEEKHQESRAFVKTRRSKLCHFFACFSCCHRGCSCRRFACFSCFHWDCCCRHSSCCNRSFCCHRRRSCC